MNKGSQDNDMTGLDSIRDLVDWVADEIEKDEKAKDMADSTGLDDMKEMESPAGSEK